jgi:hypothetical protein
LVGRVAQMLADIKRAEAEEAAKKKPPVEFGTEPAIRTEGFQTTDVPKITEDAGDET